MQARQHRVQGCAASAPVRSTFARPPLLPQRYRSAAQPPRRRAAHCTVSAGGTADALKAVEELAELQDRQQTARESGEALLRLLQVMPRARWRRPRQRHKLMCKAAADRRNQYWLQSHCMCCHLT